MEEKGLNTLHLSHLGTRMSHADPPLPKWCCDIRFFPSGTIIEKSDESPPNWAWKIQGPCAASLCCCCCCCSITNKHCFIINQPLFLASAIPPFKVPVRHTPYLFRS